MHIYTLYAHIYLQATRTKAYDFKVQQNHKQLFFPYISYKLECATYCMLDENNMSHYRLLEKRTFLQMA